jgi:acyl carrier protein
VTVQDFTIGYISEALLDGDADGLRADTPIIELNIIDSAAIFDLVHALQAEYGITVPLRDITPVNFTSVNAIAALVDRLEKEEKSVR